jgi:hypothetical protein
VEFRTKVPIEGQVDHLIDYESRLVFLGSCFSDAIGEKFQHAGFKSTVNPIGVLFQPQAIERFVHRAINMHLYKKEDLGAHNGLYYCFETHSKFNSTEGQTTLTHLNNALKTTNKALKVASHIFITLGTSWVYRYLKKNKIVANCHKVPQKEFNKELLSVETVKKSLEAILGSISEINPKAVCILTISPVRHLKDGFIENNRSKAHLIAAVHELVEPTKKVFYFPSYELLMDELRDYRFYKTDMVHPSDQSVNYIWTQLQSSWLSASARALQSEITAYKKSMAHQPMHPDSIEHRQFLQELDKKRQELLKKVPHLKF